ncbi:Smr/MutS family protein, partial [bacterium]|nr:Smr/MutS family protein [bacterium]
LDQKIQQQTELVRKAERKNAELTSVLKLYQDKVDTLEKHQRKLKKQAAEEADKVLADANAALEKSIREIRETKASKEAIKSAKVRIATTKGEVAKVRRSLNENAKKTSRKKLKPEDLRPGQTAQWQKYTSPVTILDYPDNSKRVLIEAGFMKTRVPIHELLLFEGKAPQRQVRSSGRMNYNLPDQLSFELDLRGRRADDALLEVDKFIDQAIIAGMSELRIIHGKGTGALKTAIDEFLRRHPSVKKHREAEWNAGDSGVTVVTLK